MDPLIAQMMDAQAQNAIRAISVPKYCLRLNNPHMLGAKTDAGETNNEGSATAEATPLPSAIAPEAALENADTLMTVAEALIRKCPTTTRLLLNKNTVDTPNTPTPLQIAVNYPSIHTLVAFIDQPDFNFRREKIEIGVALNLMLYKAGVEVEIKYLRRMLARGARIHYGHFGMTAFHVAAELGRIDILQVLLEHMSKEEIKADINLQCSSCHAPDGRGGKTALAIAAMKGHVYVGAMLLEHGAQSEIKDDKGKTALQLSEEAGLMNCLNREDKREVAFWRSDEVKRMKEMMRKWMREWESRNYKGGRGGWMK